MIPALGAFSADPPGDISQALLSCLIVSASSYLLEIAAIKLQSSLTRYSRMTYRVAK